jgi:squalene-associated FAD-dependent desaturase
MMRPDVIVIGAGFAGLSAATMLAERGGRVLVLEARPGLGGRATSFRDPETGERVDNGQHLMMGCYDETLRFLDRIGARDRVRIQSGLAVPMVDRAGHATELRLPPLPAPLHLLAGVLGWPALGWRDRLSVLRLGRALSANVTVPGTVTSTVRQFLIDHGQTPRLIELLWEPLAVAALNQSIDQAAAAPFITVLSRVFGPDADRASLVVPAAPLDEMYAEPARAWLTSRGHDVRTNAPASVLVEGERVAGVTVRGERIHAAAVISTVPWHAVAGLFDAGIPAALDPAVRAASAMASSPIATVNLWYDRSVMDEPLLGLPARRFQWVFNKWALVGARASHLTLVSSGAEDVVALPNEALIRIARSEIEDALPRARGAELLKASAVRERRATFSLAPGEPPRPGARTPIGGFLLAGDWIDTGLPATIESAVVSGHRAAMLAATRH